LINKSKNQKAVEGFYHGQPFLSCRKSGNKPAILPAQVLGFLSTFFSGGFSPPAPFQVLRSVASFAVLSLFFLINSPFL
jgi:hypothetical protein